MRRIVVLLVLVLLANFVFAANFNNCATITTAGISDQLNGDVAGANQNSGEIIGGSTACIKIAAPNKIFDCNGHTITNNGTGGTTIGIAINGSAYNVTIRNCGSAGGSSIGNYTYGILVGQFGSPVENNSILNVTVYNSTYGIYLSNRNTVKNATVYNSTYGFDLGSANNNTINDSQAYNNTNTGFYLNFCSRNNLSNNLAYNNSNYGFQLDVSVNNNTFINNSAYGNRQSGFYLDSNSNNNTFINNTAYNNSVRGFYIYQSSNEVFINNSARNNSVESGFTFDTSENNTLINNSAYNNTNIGFYFYEYDNNSVLTGNNAHNNSNPGGAYGFYFRTDCNNNTLTNNTAYFNARDGFTFDIGNNNVLRGNIAYNNTGGAVYGFSLNANNTAINNTAYSNGYGFVLFANTTLINNTAYLHTGGFDFWVTSSGRNNTLTNNVAHNSTNGFEVDTSQGNSLVNNSAYYESSYGFYLVSSFYNNLTNNSGYNNTQCGFLLASSYGNNLTNNSGYSNTQPNGCGLGVSNSDNNTLTNNTAYNNTGSGGTGFSIYDSNGTRVTNMHLYNNEYDFYMTNDLAGTYLFNATGMVFDNPLSGYRNFTNITMNDTLRSESYYMNWSFNSSALPANKLTFAQKYLDIVTVSGTPSLASILWTWTGAESANYTEANFGLWKYNASGWNNTGAALDTAAHTLSLTNLNPGSTYGILVNGTNCPVINSSGIYNMTSNFTGAPNNASEIITGGVACVKIAASNVVFDCNGYNMTAGAATGVPIGIALNGSITNVTVQNCPNISGYFYGLYVYNSSNSYFRNISVFDYEETGFTINTSSNNNVLTNSSADGSYSSVSVGFGLSGNSNNTLANNTALGNAVAGFRFFSSSNNRLINNTALDGGQDGFALTSGSDNNTFTNNTANNNQYWGFSVDSSSNNTFANNTAFNSTYEDGFYVYLSSSNSLIGNTAYNNSLNGFSVDSSTNNTLTNNSAHGNSQNGIYAASSSDNTALANNTVFNNSYGVVLENSNASLSGGHLYNNGRDFVADETFAIGSSINLTAVIFDNPQGNFQNYTSLTINDTLISQSYYINWSTNSSALPANHISFAQKFVNITNLTAGVSIDSIAWSWTDAEASNYTESRFELWKYNATANWTNTNATLNTSANTLTLTNMNPGSIYGILQNNITNCPAVASSYAMAGNFTGAPNDASEVAPGSLACVKITSSNVVFDCNGYMVTNNGTAGTTYGILLNGSLTNVTVQNCPGIANYTYGVYVYQSNNSYFLNNTAFNNSQDGFSVSSGFYNVFSNDTAFNDSQYAFHLSSSYFNNISGSVAYQSTRGFYVDSSGNTTIIGSAAYNNSNAGFFLGTSSGNDLENNLAYNNTAGFNLNPSSSNNTLVNNTANLSSNGFILSSNSDSNSLANNTAANSTNYGFWLLGSSDGNNLTGNTAFNNTDGFHINSSSSNNVLSGNTARNNSQNGFTFSSNSNNTLYGNTAYGNNNFGYSFLSSSFNVLSNDNAFNNSVTGFFFQASSYNNVSAGSSHNNSEGYGFFFGSENNTIINSTAYNNSLEGFHVQSRLNTFRDCTSFNNTNNGFLVQNDSNTIINNTVHSNGQSGFFIQTTFAILLANNTAYNTNTGIAFLTTGPCNATGNDVFGNSMGISFDRSTNSILAGNRVRNNTNSGVDVRDSNFTRITGDHYYNNSVDFRTEDTLGQTHVINLSAVAFDSPSGVFQNFTNLSLNHTLAAGSGFEMAWSSQPASPTPGFFPFAGKFISISTTSGTVSISRITWGWNASEASGHNESRLQLWKYNASGWTLLNNTPDTVSHTLGLANLNPASVFAILEQNDTTPPSNFSLNSPPDNYTTNVTTINFNFNVTDDYSTTMNCSLYIDGLLNQTNATTANNTATGFSVTVTPGPHTWYVQCTDQANNTNASATRNLLVDVIPPGIAQSFPADNYITNIATVNFNLTATDDFSATMNCSLYIDGLLNRTNASAINGSATVFTVVMAQGLHTWYVLCTDQAGNTNASSTRNLTVDTTPPTATLNAPVNGLNTSSTTLSFNFTETDNIFPTAVCNLTIDSVQVNSTTANNNTATILGYSGLTNGTHFWNVSCFDNAGNINYSATRYFTVGTSAPTVTLNAPQNGLNTSLTALNFNFTETDNVFPTAVCNLTIDSVQVNSTTANNNTATILGYSGLTNGTHFWNVSCFDNAGNINYSATRYFTVDFTPPNIAQNFPPDNYLTNITEVNFNFTATDDFSTDMNCSLFVDSILNQTNASTVNGLATNFSVSVTPGTHSWYVRCTDQANNTNTSATRNLLVDVVPPNVNLDSPPDSYLTNVSTTDFNFTATDDFSATMNCSLFIDSILSQGNGTTANNTMTTLAASSADGIHAWYVQCLDQANNSNVSLTRSFTTDTTPPNINLTFPPDAYLTNVSTVTFNFTATDALSASMSCSLYLDGILNQTNASTLNDTPTSFTETLSGGAHSWSISCTDQANNTNSSETRGMYTDVVPPDIQLISPYNGYSAFISVPIPINFNFTATDDNSTVMNCSLYIDGILNYTNSSVLNNTMDNVSLVFDVGTHSWFVSCTDTGNNTNVSQVFSFTLSHPIISSSGGAPSCSYKSIGVSLTPGCDRNTVTVTSGGSLEGASVRVLRNGFTIASGTTDSGGNFYFTALDGSVDILVQKSQEGTTCYSTPPTFTESLNATVQCAIPECVKDTDCPVNYTCTNNRCVALPPTEKPPPPPPPQPGQTGSECVADYNCDFNQYCSANKTCQPVNGTCGYPLNHKWVSYECCQDSQCPAGEICDNHECREVSYALRGNSTGYVGENGTVTAYSDGQALPGTTLRITNPDGTKATVQTDANGNAVFTLMQAGDYTVELLVNGVAVRTFRITSVGQGVPLGVSKRPTIFDIAVQAGGGLLLLVVLAVVAFLVYRFYFVGRGTGRETYKKK